VHNFQQTKGLHIVLLYVMLRRIICTHTELSNDTANAPDKKPCCYARVLSNT